LSIPGKDLLIYFLRERLERERVCMCVSKTDFFETEEEKKTIILQFFYTQLNSFSGLQEIDGALCFKKVLVFFIVKFNRREEEKDPNPIIITLQLLLLPLWLLK